MNHFNKQKKIFKGIKLTPRTTAILIGLIGLYFLASFLSEKHDKEMRNAKYVECSLNALFFEEYQNYADFLGVEEPEVREVMEKKLRENSEQSFYAMGVTDIDEEAIEEYMEVVREAGKLARYEVTGTEEKEDGYVAKVQVEPRNCFLEMQGAMDELYDSAIAQGMDVNDQKVFISIVCESLWEGIERCTYEDPVETEIFVKKTDSHYDFADGEYEKFQEVIFTQSILGQSEDADL